MSNSINRPVIALVLCLLLIPTALAQQSNTTQEKAKDEFVTERQFKSKVFEVKYRDPSSIASVVRHLGSGFQGAAMSTNSEFKTLTVRDFPENLATIEEAIKRLDIAAAPRPNIEMRMHVLLASNGPGPGTTGEIPAELKDVLTQLRGTLAYRNYEVITSVLQRLTETPNVLNGSGQAQIPGQQPTRAQYEYYIHSLSIQPSSSGSPLIQIREFGFTLTGEGIRGRVGTALNLRDGEKVVVGTATINDRAFIVVLIPKIM